MGNSKDNIIIHIEKKKREKDRKMEEQEKIDVKNSTKGRQAGKI